MLSPNPPDADATSARWMLPYGLGALLVLLLIMTGLIWFRTTRSFSDVERYSFSFANREYYADFGRDEGRPPGQLLALSAGSAPQVIEIGAPLAELRPEAELDAQRDADLQRASTNQVTDRPVPTPRDNWLADQGFRPLTPTVATNGRPTVARQVPTSGARLEVLGTPLPPPPGPPGRAGAPPTSTSAPPTTPTPRAPAPTPTAIRPTEDPDAPIRTPTETPVSRVIIR